MVSHCSEPASGSTVHPQTAVVTAQCPMQGVVRTSDIRVSERTPLMHIRQKFFGPIYNELAEDVRTVISIVVYYYHLDKFCLVGQYNYR